jgi:hypothetical protein
LDRLTHTSITNAIKELEALKGLVLCGAFTEDEIADFIEEISWCLARTFQRHRYDSDEMRMLLAKELKRNKPKDPGSNDE